MSRSFVDLLKDESGATAIEYGLIAALVSVAAVVTLQALGVSLNSIFGTVSTTLDTAEQGMPDITGPLACPLWDRKRSIIDPSLKGSF
jgi:pilus assembly protein Flp/PilA